jgi:hypothetical protein
MPTVHGGGGNMNPASSRWGPRRHGSGAVDKELRRRAERSVFMMTIAIGCGGPRFTGSTLIAGCLPLYGCSNSAGNALRKWPVATSASRRRIGLLVTVARGGSKPRGRNADTTQCCVGYRAGAESISLRRVRPVRTLRRRAQRLCAPATTTFDCPNSGSALRSSSRTVSLFARS